MENNHLIEKLNEVEEKLKYIVSTQEFNNNFDCQSIQELRGLEL